MKLWKTIAAVLVLLLVTAGALALMFRTEPEVTITEVEEPYWDARTIIADSAYHRPQIQLIGQIEPIQDSVEVALLSSEVLVLHKQDGDSVEKGELIVQLDDFDAQIQLQQLQADLADLESQIKLFDRQQVLDTEALKVEQDNLTLLNSRLKKQKTLNNAQTTIDDLQQQVQRQQFAVLQRQTALENQPLNRTQLEVRKRKLQLAIEQAQRNLDNTEVRADFTGKLAQVTVKPGQRTNPGQALFRLYSNQQMSVKVQLPVHLQPVSSQLDGTVMINDVHRDIAFLRSESQLNPGQAGFYSWFALDPETDWLPGDFIRVRLNLPAIEGTYQIPATALFQDRWMYRVDAEQHLQAVEVDVLGSTQQAQQTLLVVQPKETINEQLRLLATRLKNPTTGMKIYEAGIDPEPKQVDDEEAETDTERDTQSDTDGSNEEGVSG